MYYYITWSPVDPLQWMGAVIMTGPNSNQKYIYHSNPHKSSPSINVLWCVFVCHYDFISFFVHNIAFSSEKVVFPESVEKKCTVQAPFTSKNSSKQICQWILIWEDKRGGCFQWRKSYDYRQVFCPEAMKTKFKNFNDGFVSYEHAVFHLTRC